MHSTAPVNLHSSPVLACLVRRGARSVSASANHVTEYVYLCTLQGNLAITRTALLHVETHNNY